VVVAIDGPGGVGKTTVARAVAAALGLPHLDTGSYYRAATLAVLEAGVDAADTDAAVRIVAAADLDYRDRRIHLDGRDVSTEARSPEVTALVSPVSAIPELRRIVVAAQRDWVRRHGGSAVVEGRDIGTVVFPDAPVKVYLTADPEVRALRRLGDAEAADVDPERVAELLRMRDRIDSTRTASPLRPADDAVIIDTSHLTAEEVVDAVLRLVEAADRTG
jgi:cytidylate kinase